MHVLDDISKFFSSIPPSYLSLYASINLFISGRYISFLFNNNLSLKSLKYFKNGTPMILSFSA